MKKQDFITNRAVRLESMIDIFKAIIMTMDSINRKDIGIKEVVSTDILKEYHLVNNSDNTILMRRTIDILINRDTSKGITTITTNYLIKDEAPCLLHNVVERDTLIIYKEDQEVFRGLLTQKSGCQPSECYCGESYYELFNTVDKHMAELEAIFPIIVSLMLDDCYECIEDTDSHEETSEHYRSEFIRLTEKINDLLTTNA